MNPDDFENQLRRTTFRPAPEAWRGEILRAARAAAPAKTEPRGWWRELLWPCPRAWAGLAAAWVVILASQYDGSEVHSAPPVQSAKAPVFQPGEIVVATAGFSSRSWAMLIDLPEPAEPPKPAIMPKRSRLETPCVVV